MKSTPSLMLLNGPTAAGKSTASQLVLERYAHRAKVAVVELDTFADMAGRHHVDPASDTAAEIWYSAMPVMAAAVKAYLRRGFSVVVPITYGWQGQRRIEKVFRSYEMQQVLLQPSWTVNRVRRMKRVAETSDWELKAFGWEAHKIFYDELAAMAEADKFDQVMNSSRRGAVSVANELASLLGIDGSSDR